jgi:hypothetical protein
LLSQSGRRKGGRIRKQQEFFFVGRIERLSTTSKVTKSERVNKALFFSSRKMSREKRDGFLDRDTSQTGICARHGEKKITQQKKKEVNKFEKLDLSSEEC